MKGPCSCMGTYSRKRDRSLYLRGQFMLVCLVSAAVRACVRAFVCKHATVCILVYLLCVDMCARLKFSFLHACACNSNSTGVRATPDSMCF